MTLRFDILGRTAFSMLAAFTIAAMMVSAAVPVLPIA